MVCLCELCAKVADFNFKQCHNVTIYKKLALKARQNVGFVVDSICKLVLSAALQR